LITTIKTNGDFTIYKNLAVNINGSTSQDYHLITYNGDTTGTIDSQVIYGEENQNSLVFNRYLRLSINGITYGVPVYTGAAGVACCSNLIGALVDCSAYFYGYALVYVNGSKRFIKLYAIDTSSSSSSTSSSGSTTSSYDDRTRENRYRFGGIRYGFRGPSTCGPSDIIFERPGLYAYPSSDKKEEEKCLGRARKRDFNKNGTDTLSSKRIKPPSRNIKMPSRKTRIAPTKRK
jgi:hypothetical protein